MIKLKAVIEIFASLHFDFHCVKNTCTKEQTVINFWVYWYIKYGGNGGYCIIKMVRENQWCLT